ncbi:unnamed protein product [Caretta caretta]
MCKAHVQSCLPQAAPSEHVFPVRKALKGCGLLLSPPAGGGRRRPRSPKPPAAAGSLDTGFTESKPSTMMHQADLNLACYIACHSEISSVDHLWEVVGSAFEKAGGLGLELMAVAS